MQAAWLNRNWSGNTQELNERAHENLSRTFRFKDEGRRIRVSL